MALRYFEQNCRSYFKTVGPSVYFELFAIIFRTEFSKIFGSLTEIALVISNFWKLKRRKW